MAMEEIKLTQNVHNEALSADVPDKKKGGKFQPFKNLFSKRRKKDATSSREVSAGRSRRPPCVSNGTVSSDEETLEDNLRSFNYSMGTRAFSHDSIFIPDGGAESEQTTQAMSQDNILGKVKTLQRQLGKNIKFGQPPPHAAPMKKADGGDTSLEEDLFLTSPIEIVTHQDVILCDSENQPSDPSSSLSPLNQPATRSEMEEKVTPVKPSRPKRHFSSAGTIESVNLDAIPRAIARLDNSAARHKLAVKPKNQRVSKRQRRLTGDPLGEHGSLLPPLSLDQNGHSGEDKLAWHEEEPEPQDPEEKRCHEEYWRELEAKCKRQKAEAAEKRRLEEQRQQALERRLWEENRQPELPEPRDEEQKLRGEGPAAPGQEWMEPEKDRAAEGDKHLQDRLQLQQALEERGRQEAEKQRQEEEEREQELWRKREEERRQEELEEQRRQEEEERRKELLRKEEERMKREEERMKELRRQEEERIKQEERMKELRRQEEERIKQEEERMKELRRQEEERIKQEERMKELRRQEEERIKQEEERLKQEERIKELRRQEEERMKQEEERMKELRRQEERMKQEEERMKQEEERMKALRKQEEERMKQEEERMKQEERMKALRRQEEERMKQEEERMKQEEERMKQEERMKALRRQEEERKRKEALRKEAETEAQRRQEAEKKVGEEERPLDLAHQRGLRSPRRRKDLAEKADSAPQPEQPGAGQEARSGEKRQPQPPEGPQGERRQGKSEGTRAQRPQKPEASKEEPPALADRSGEELRWREVDERQSTPRPYTFQVSSGGKQILFPKVNLSPVTPLKEAGLASVPQEPKAPKASAAPHSLPSALSVPHTAILVTGAQLCGPAVNLSQIKDTACRSLLGLSEEKKHVEAPAPEQQPPRAPGDPRAGSGRARPPQEPPSSEGALAEWVSIRSRILKNAEGEPRGDKEPPGPEGDGEEARASDLRKAPSISAKFCIKPAWQKFADSDGESSRKRTAPAAGEGAARPPPAAADAQEPTKGLEKSGVQREPADTTEGCKFAKDLPSFLVPGLPSPPLQPPSPQKAAAPGEPVSALDSEARGSRKPDPAAAGGEEKASPFGIKLRRTNYSLRFHSDQQAEQKKKKRHSSTGESGGAAGGERETAPQPGPALAPPDRPPVPASAESAPDHSAPAAQPAPPPANTHSPTPEHKATHKMPMVQKPALAPKPTSQTPPSSPLSKLSRPYLAELLSRRPGKPDAEPGELSKEPGARPPQPPSPPPQPPDEDLGPERKPSSPAHPASRGEKPSQSPEPERREKPVLQSRHSLDGSRLAEKGEPAQPLWVTLALQKQKGFREQQATREERKQAREARQAEKFSKDNASISRAGSLHKPVTQPEAQKPEELKPDTAVTRLERREHLKKANTLPTSVTVEISDSAPPVPLVKEVTKRLSTPDAAPMSTEPAWLALAKRKAKAWSDCPQIIK